MRQSFLKRSWPYLLAIAVGLSVTIISLGYMHQSEAQKPVYRLPVPARDLPPYTVIEQEDLTVAVFNNPIPNAVATAAEAAGKVAVTPLSKNAPIDRGSLAEAGAAKDVQIVSVNVAPARMAGVKAGDIVDVYWIQPAEQSAWSPGTGATLVAQNARVVNVLDQAGQPVNSVQGIAGAAVASAANKQAAIVNLAVKTTEVKAVVPGGSPKNESIALVKKFEITETEGGVAVANPGGSLSVPPGGQPGGDHQPAPSGTSSR